MKRVYHKRITNIFCYKTYDKRGGKMYKCFSIREELDKYMVLKGFTNNSLADRLGITYQHLSSVRHKKINTSPKLAKRIADALDVEITDIFTIEAKEEVNQ